MAKTTASASGVNRNFAAPVKQQNRREHNADGKRGNKSRDRDLLRAIQHRPHQRLLHRQIAMGILNFDGGVVHQNSDRQRQPAQRHHVDGVAHQLQDDQRSQNRKRNRDADDHRAAPASEKQQDHQPGEQRGDSGFLALRR